MTTGSIIQRQISQILPARYSYSQNIDIFCHDLWSPDQINSMFIAQFDPYSNIHDFNDTTHADAIINDDTDEDDDDNDDEDS